MDYSNKKAKTLLKDIKEKKSVRIVDESGTYYVNYKSVAATVAEVIIETLSILAFTAVLVLAILF